MKRKFVTCCSSKCVYPEPYGYIQEFMSVQGSVQGTTVPNVSK